MGTAWAHGFFVGAEIDRRVQRHRDAQLEVHALGESVDGVELVDVLLEHGEAEAQVTNPCIAADLQRAHALGKTVGNAADLVVRRVHSIDRHTHGQVPIDAQQIGQHALGLSRLEPVRRDDQTRGRVRPFDGREDLGEVTPQERFAAADVDVTQTRRQTCEHFRTRLAVHVVLPDVAHLATRVAIQRHRHDRILRLRNRPTRQEFLRRGEGPDRRGIR